jgi:hypothetical protein
MTKKKSRSKRQKRGGSTQSKNRAVSAPRSIEDYEAMSDRGQQLWDDIGQITTAVRSGLSLNQAAHKFKRDPRTVQRLGKPALRKLRNGRWAAKRTDRLLRVLQRLTPEGKVEVALSDSRQATVLGKYWNAVELYRDTGDSSRLQEFEGEYIIDAAGNHLPLLTDLGTIDRLGSAGVLSFETLYARVA